MSLITVLNVFKVLQQCHNLPTISFGNYFHNGAFQTKKLRDLIFIRFQHIKLSIVFIIKYMVL